MSTSDNLNTWITLATVVLVGIGWWRLNRRPPEARTRRQRTPTTAPRRASLVYILSVYWHLTVLQWRAIKAAWIAGRERVLRPEVVSPRAIPMAHMAQIAPPESPDVALFEHERRRVANWSLIAANDTYVEPQDQEEPKLIPLERGTPPEQAPVPAPEQPEPPLSEVQEQAIRVLLAAGWSGNKIVQALPKNRQQTYALIRQIKEQATVKAA